MTDPAPRAATGTPLFLKQYGAKRTGTNYLRALIRSNYPAEEVVPLMHILGGKHAAPPPFGELWRRAQDDVDPAFSFVMGATRYAPPANPDPDHPRQREAVRSLAAPLARAFCQGSLGFLVSIKDPYAWVVSMARFEGWTLHPGSTSPDPVEDRVAGLCAGFNACYAAWLALARDYGERCHVVCYEELLADPGRMLCRLDTRFGLRRAGEALVDLPTHAGAAIWDLDPPVITGYSFNRAYYEQKRYFQHLPPPLVDVVTRSIDWELIAPLGYAPHGACS
jgi:hypothetical protein